MANSSAVTNFVQEGPVKMLSVTDVFLIGFLSSRTFPEKSAYEDE